ncbi:hypothetical protein AAFF_G00370140 [Aldrovandia affinis]|uniref:Uncharacterized protein n=1 Tax=Aldrovandia affinis TaxID=143900 RepID=A0AAD7WN44_9TELE|nr:hypothetical protein AAFF_G00370140 [Aldrovandia affinis]
MFWLQQGVAVIPAPLDGRTHPSVSGHGRPIPPSSARCKGLCDLPGQAERSRVAFASPAGVYRCHVLASTARSI